MRLFARFLAALFAFASLAANAQQHSHAGHADHSFGNAEMWAKRFDDPARDAWQKPDEVVRALKLAPNAVVADLGAGTGYFAVRLARAVPAGRVFAVDVEPDMVRYLEGRAKREGLANLTPVRGTAKSPALPAPVDAVLLVDVYHHVGGRIDYFSSLRSSLKPNGRVAIVDFNEATRRGPRERIAPAVVKDEMARAGYRLAEEHTFLPDQYFLVFSPRD